MLEWPSLECAAELGRATRPAGCWIDAYRGFTATPSEAQDKQQVTVWSWFIQSTMKESIEAFNKAHPNITVKPVDILAAVVGFGLAISIPLAPETRGVFLEEAAAATDTPEVAKV